MPATSRELGITLGLENHYKDGHWRYPSSPRRWTCFLDLVASIDDTTNFGIQYDRSNAVVAGDDPIVNYWRKVAPRVVSMHASDRYLEEGHTLEELRTEDGTLGYAPYLKHGVTAKASTTSTKSSPSSPALATKAG